MPPRYQTLGGHRQMVVESHQDLLFLEELDRARWAVTSAPVEDLHLDDTLAEFLSRESGGRIRAGDLIELRDWLFLRLQGREDIDTGESVLRLQNLHPEAPEACLLRGIAEEVLANLPEGEASDRLSLEQLRSYRQAFDQTLANGDGLVVPGEIPDPEVSQFAASILQTVGGREDLSGAPGVGKKEVDAFLEGATRFLAWRAQPEKDPSIRPWGGQTAAAWAAYDGLREVIEDWFRRCDLLAQEGRDPPGLEEEDWRVLWKDQDGAISAFLADSPLTRPVPSGELDLKAEVYPAFREVFRGFKELVLSRVLEPGAERLDRAAWGKVVAIMTPHGKWKAARPSRPFHEVPEAFLEEQHRKELAERVRSFVRQDKAATEKLHALEDLERLILLQAWILELAQNIVCFHAVYDLNSPALFQMGTLIIDGRRLRMTVRVQDRAEHQKVAALSKVFLIYVVILDPKGKTAFEIAAPVTAGERGRLRIGKRGLFLDRDGVEWDAEIVALVENSISLREAILAPFHRFAGFVSDRFEALASSQLAVAEKKVTEAAEKGQIGSLAPLPLTQPAAAPTMATAPPPRSSIQNVMVMGSLATAALGSAAAFIMKVLAETNPLHFLGSFFGIILFVAATSGFLGWLRLRKRDISLLLEANDWAVNAPMALSRSLGETFTIKPVLPGEALHSLWNRFLILLMALLVLGYLWDEGRLKLATWLRAQRPPQVTAPLVPGVAP